MVREFVAEEQKVCGGFNILATRAYRSQEVKVMAMPVLAQVTKLYAKLGQASQTSVDNIVIRTWIATDGF